MSEASGALTDVAGIHVGHFTDPRRPTGCSVVLCPDGAVAGVDVRGAAPGTRETELLSPVNAIEKVHAVLLAGGSAFGLDAAGGVMRWLEEREIGVEVGKARAGDRAGESIRVPIVPAAILFDLWVGDARIRPDAAAGYAACVAAGTLAPAEGSVGAGAAAREHALDVAVEDRDAFATAERRDRRRRRAADARQLLELGRAARERVAVIGNHCLRTAV